MILRTTICSFLLIVTTILNAQSPYQLESPEECRELSKKAMVLFEENKISDAFKKLGNHWPVPENEADNLETKTIKYMSLLIDNFGYPIGNTKTSEQKITDIAIRETYLLL
ncbi:MAG: hypothetical protein ACI94Y_002995 [Maribacter sp.]|jgi:hypothetical protein